MRVQAHVRLQIESTALGRGQLLHAPLLTSEDSLLWRWGGRCSMLLAPLGWIGLSPTVSNWRWKWIIKTNHRIDFSFFKKKVFSFLLKKLKLELELWNCETV